MDNNIYLYMDNKAPIDRKLNPKIQTNQTVVKRGLIDANWQKLLSNTLLMENEEVKPERDIKKDEYTGLYRRARKGKKKHDVSPHVLNKLSLDDKTPVNNINNNNKQEKEESNNTGKCKLTKFIAMDCEMVGIGFDGGDHMLARISLVNKFGDCIYDKYVKPREEVKDYRTKVSGIRKENLVNGEEFSIVQKDIAEILKGRILVGHSLKHDLNVLFLSHPKKNIRDTSKYKPFRKITKGSTPSLKCLAKEVLGIDIQHGEHSSVEDARAAMKLYCTVAKNWEQLLSQTHRK